MGSNPGLGGARHLWEKNLQLFQVKKWPGTRKETVSTVALIKTLRDTVKITDCQHMTEIPDDVETYTYS